MSPDKSQLETVTIDAAATTPLNQTSSPSQQNRIGELLGDRYQVEAELGRGGVGAVYLARDRKLHDKRVVVKILLDESLTNAWVVQKFQQEREALARVDHPGVVGILDSGELRDGKPYLVMQFINGVTLRSQIKPEGIPLERAGEIIKQTSRALAAAHDQGILHRDLKPENIMLQSFHAGEEQVKIIDFGIAKIKDSIVAPSTVTGSTAGTVAYMAPEQLSGRKVSPATDVFALGAIAYELVTGRKPFNPETGFELLELQRAGVRVPPKDLRPSLSHEASDLILRALSFEPQQRFASAREFGDAFSRALALCDSQAPQTGPAVPATQLVTSPNEPPRQTADGSSKTLAARFEPARLDTLNKPSFNPDEEGPRPTNRGRRTIAVLLVVALIAGGGGLGIWKFRGLFGGRERSLTYSLTVQKMRDDKPYQGEFQSSGQEIFENGWKFRMNLSSPQEGNLYLLNEGPGGDDTTTYNVLFPEAQTNGGSAHVSANQKMQTAWMRFDNNQGTEKFWIVWSASPVMELEAVKQFVNDHDLGQVKDASKARAVRQFLQQHASTKTEITKDSENDQTVAKTKGDLLVNKLELKHH